MNDKQKENEAIEKLTEIFIAKNKEIQENPQKYMEDNKEEIKVMFRFEENPYGWNGDWGD